MQFARRRDAASAAPRCGTPTPPSRWRAILDGAGAGGAAAARPGGRRPRLGGLRGAARHRHGRLRRLQRPGAVPRRGRGHAPGGGPAGRPRHQPALLRPDDGLSAGRGGPDGRSRTRPAGAPAGQRAARGRRGSARASPTHAAGAAASTPLGSLPRCAGPGSRPSWITETASRPSCGVDAALAEAAAAGRGRALLVVQQPLVGPERPVEPHGVVQAGARPRRRPPSRRGRGRAAPSRAASCRRRRWRGRRAAAGRRAELAVGAEPHLGARLARLARRVPNGGSST